MRYAFLKVESNSFFLILKSFGVISTNSSSLIYAIMSSNANVFGGNKFNFSSANTVLTFVNFFSLIGLTSISYSNLFSPIT